MNLSVFSRHWRFDERDRALGAAQTGRAGVHTRARSMALGDALSTERRVGLARGPKRPRRTSERSARPRWRAMALSRWPGACLWLALALKERLYGLLLTRSALSDQKACGQWQIFHLGCHDIFLFSNNNEPTSPPAASSPPAVRETEVNAHQQEDPHPMVSASPLSSWCQVGYYCIMIVLVKHEKYYDRSENIIFLPAS